MDTPSLPETLNETLSLAISDARLLSRSDYHPHYYFWHGHQDHQCKVCLTGSIMARTLNVDRLTITSPGCFPPEISGKLHAVNSCRAGEFLDAFYYFYGYFPSSQFQARLKALPVPENFDFIGWEEFDVHLASIESIVPILAEIEREALES